MSDLPAVLDECQQHADALERALHDARLTAQDEHQAFSDRQLTHMHMLADDLASQISHHRTAIRGT